MHDPLDLVGADDIFEFVVIANVRSDKWNFGVVLCAQVNDARFKTLVERVIDDDGLASADEFVSNVCADVSGTSREKPRLLSHRETIAISEVFEWRSQI